jgi:hypothetical protein
MLATDVERTICPLMQRLLSLFVAFALLIVPMGMIGGAAGAHGGSTQATMPTDCHESAPAPEKKSKGVGMSADCALACAALPAIPVWFEVPPALAPVIHPTIALHGLVTAGPESLDPPPRA